MSKHIADHRKASDGGRMAHFLRIARQSSEEFWRGLQKRPMAETAGNRRVVEYVRIARGRQT